VQDHLNEDPALLLFKYQGKTDFDLNVLSKQISARKKSKEKATSLGFKFRFDFSGEYLFGTKQFGRNSEFLNQMDDPGKP